MGNTCYGSFEELDLFAAERREIEEQSCKVTAGTGQALNPPTGDRIVFQVNSDDRDGGRGPHCSHERILRCCENDIALEIDKLFGEIGKPVERRFKNSGLDQRILTVDVPGVTRDTKSPRTADADPSLPFPLIGRAT